MATPSGCSLRAGARFSIARASIYSEAAAGTQEWGTPLKYVNIAPGEHCEEMAAAGEDPWWMYAYSTMFASIREQRWAAVSGEIHRLTGRSPTAVRTALARYKAG